MKDNKGVQSLVAVDRAHPDLRAFRVSFVSRRARAQSFEKSACCDLTLNGCYPWWRGASVGPSGRWSACVGISHHELLLVRFMLSPAAASQPRARTSLCLYVSAFALSPIIVFPAQATTVTAAAKAAADAAALAAAEGASNDSDTAIKAFELFKLSHNIKKMHGASRHSVGVCWFDSVLDQSGHLAES